LRQWAYSAQFNPRTILPRSSGSVLLQETNAKKSLEQKRQKIESETVMIVVGYLSGTPGYLAN
jgi:hypothetical protein